MKRPSTSTPPRPRPTWLLVGALAWMATAGAGTSLAQPVAPEAGAPSLGLPLYQSSGLETRWRLLRASPPGSEAEERAFEGVLAARAELGIPELPAHASLLVREARVAWLGGSRERAEALLGWALVLAPSSAEPDFARADLLWSSDPWAVGELFEATALAYRRAWVSPLDGPVTRLHWALLAQWALLVVAFAFGLVQLARYARLAAYDLASLVGHVVSRTWTALVLLAALAVPSVLLQSPVLLLLLALALPFVYQNLSERLATLVLLGALALLPMWMASLGELVARGNSVVPTVFEAERGPCGPDCSRRLEALARSPSAASSYAALTVASVHLRSGQPEDRSAAVALLEPELEHPVLGALAWLHLGRARYAAGDLEAASLAWEHASSMANGDPTVGAAAHFNLSRLARDRGADGVAELERARALDRDRVDAFAVQGEPRVNRWLMSVTTPVDAVRALADADGRAGARAAADDLWRLLGGHLGRHAAFGVALTAFVLVALGGLVRRHTRTAAGCPTCGAIRSPRDAPEAAAAGYCSDCFALFMAGAALGSNERRLLESRVDRFLKRSRRWWVAGNVLGAGLGFLGRGRAWLGLPLMALALAGGVVWFVSAPAVTRSLAFAPNGFDGRPALAIACWVVAYSTGWFLTWRRWERRAR